MNKKRLHPKAVRSFLVWNLENGYGNATVCEKFLEALGEVES